ncbi:tyrosine-type recombinase/integrase, partial [Enterococcus sp.]|uniref:tyrosine-type recombinase/integrase n=1 Tax=Enterococcus sp. TaxID=35783 RepID=UPI002898C683
TNWLELYKAPSLKPNSYKRLKCTVDTHVIPNIGHITLGELSTDDIQGLINNLSQSKEPQYSFSSIKKVHDAINSCLQDGVNKGDFSFNACSAVKLPSIDKRKPTKKIQIFTADEKKAIIEECHRKYKNGKPVYYYGDMYVLIFNTGLRLGEALALRWDDVDFENNVVHIDSTLTWLRDANNKGYLAVQDSTKTSSGVRDIPLNKAAVAALKALKETGSKVYVLETPERKHVAPENFEKTFYRILQHCNIPKTGVHTIRHTFASDLFAKGVALKTISSLLGHSSISVTANIYVSVIQDVKQASVSLLDEDDN